jgi:benzoate/toluate 1,2-dioxygenase reductase subunit
MSIAAYDVSLTFKNGHSRAFTVKDGQSVLDAALAAEIPVLNQCHSGSCSSCLATLTEGQAGTRAGASSTLLPSEFESGQRLLCLTHPRSDCSFALNYDSDIASGKPVKARAFIDEVERLAHNVVRLTVELADGDWLEFKSGQFVQITVPGVGTVRSYSPASTARDLPKIVLLVRLLPDGAMSNYLRDAAKPDDVLEIEGPFGNFFVREKVMAPHIFVAGGTGIAPILSIIDSIRLASGRRPPMLLSFGCARPEDLFCLDDIELRQQWLPGLEARISVDRDVRDSLLLGNPVDALHPADVEDPGTVAYLCGPPPMVDAAIVKLQALGVRRDNIFAEHFTPTYA